MTEKEQLSWAIQQILFVYKTLNLVHKKYILPEHYVPKVDMQFDTGEKFVILEFDKMDDEQLGLAMNNLLVTAASACFTAADVALERRFTKSSFKGWVNKPNQLNAIREVVYLIRCAYAHSLPDVHWVISPNRRNAVYEIVAKDGRTILLNTSDKHGEKFGVSDIGGVENFMEVLFLAEESC